ncbi:MULTISPECIES: hypothetical protein [unclassified Paenibacillus]|uniref:hypothetical protein n=1 Tax=unclassified Paenibacillus TaxID=185978 RepID=UPI00277E07DC|nr:MULTISPECIES: hypothetical protein [unclassified Paenibacillus]MDQ0896276.1 UDP-N-acetylglucosamine transferase subunit ALG13 [Paenibacillus sp. V4I7]MDQ0913796.1 UDP-N-acetylglucosamine transferase subunit ALG13 [Paenibacillus sp. V4I5]
MGRHPKAGNSGYEAGQGRTFTPSAGAEWIEEFNSMMSSLKKSRNEMTEDLIRDGLMARKGKETGLTTFYNDAEIDFLKNPIMQKLVKDYYLIMHGAAPSTILQDLLLDKPSSVAPVMREKSNEAAGITVDRSSIPSSDTLIERSPEVVINQHEEPRNPEQPDNDEMDLLKKAAKELTRMALKKTNQ